MAEEVEQAEIPGTEQKRLPDVERAAKKYAEQRRLHAQIGKDKKNALAKLTEKMKEHRSELDGNNDGAYSYVRGGFELVLSEKDSVQVEVPGEEIAEDAN